MNGNKDKNSFGKLEVTLPSGGEYGGGTVGVAELDKRREKLFEESKVLGTKGKDALGGAQGKGQ